MEELAFAGLILLPLHLMAVLLLPNSYVSLLVFIIWDYNVDTDGANED